MSLQIPGVKIQMMNRGLKSNIVYMFRTKKLVEPRSASDIKPLFHTVGCSLARFILPTWREESSFRFVLSQTVLGLTKFTNKEHQYLEHL
jgi:hypothetical protein